MKVFKLIELLQKLPPDIEVEVNDNVGGEIYEIEQVDHFELFEVYDDYPVVILQVNC